MKKSKTYSLTKLPEITIQKKQRIVQKARKFDQQFEINQQRQIANSQSIQRIRNAQFLMRKSIAEDFLRQEDYLQNSLRKSIAIGIKGSTLKNFRSLKKLPSQQEHSQRYQSLRPINYRSERPQIRLAAKFQSIESKILPRKLNLQKLRQNQKDAKQKEKQQAKKSSLKILPPVHQIPRKSLPFYYTSTSDPVQTPFVEIKQEEGQVLVRFPNGYEKWINAENMFTKIAVNEVQQFAAQKLKQAEKLYDNDINIDEKFLNKMLTNLCNSKTVSKSLKKILYEALLENYKMSLMRFNKIYEQKLWVPRRQQQKKKTYVSAKVKQKLDTVLVCSEKLNFLGTFNLSKLKFMPLLVKSYQIIRKLSQYQHFSKIVSLNNKSATQMSNKNVQEGVKSILSYSKDRIQMIIFQLEQHLGNITATLHRHIEYVIKLNPRLEGTPYKQYVRMFIDQFTSHLGVIVRSVLTQSILGQMGVLVSFLQDYCRNVNKKGIVHINHPDNQFYRSFRSINQSYILPFSKESVQHGPGLINIQFSINRGRRIKYKNIYRFVVQSRQKIRKMVFQQQQSQQQKREELQSPTKSPLKRQKRITYEDPRIIFEQNLIDNLEGYLQMISNSENVYGCIYNSKISLAKQDIFSGYKERLKRLAFQMQEEVLMKFQVYFCLWEIYFMEKSYMDDIITLYKRINGVQLIKDEMQALQADLKIAMGLPDQVQNGILRLNLRVIKSKIIQTIQSHKKRILKASQEVFGKLIDKGYEATVKAKKMNEIQQYTNILEYIVFLNIMNNRSVQKSILSIAANTVTIDKNYDFLVQHNYPIKFAYFRKFLESGSWVKILRNASNQNKKRIIVDPSVFMKGIQQKKSKVVAKYIRIVKQLNQVMKIQALISWDKWATVSHDIKNQLREICKAVKEVSDEENLLELQYAPQLKKYSENQLEGAIERAIQGVVEGATEGAAEIQIQKNQNQVQSSENSEKKNYKTNLTFFIKQFHAFQKFQIFWSYIQKFKTNLDRSQRACILDIEAESLLSIIRQGVQVTAYVRSISVNKRLLSLVQTLSQQLDRFVKAIRVLKLQMTGSENSRIKIHNEIAKQQEQYFSTHEGMQDKQGNKIKKPIIKQPYLMTFGDILENAQAGHYSYFSWSKMFIIRRQEQIKQAYVTYLNTLKFVLKNRQIETFTFQGVGAKKGYEILIISDQLISIVTCFYNYFSNASKEHIHLIQNFVGEQNVIIEAQKTLKIFISALTRIKEGLQKIKRYYGWFQILLPSISMDLYRQYKDSYELIVSDLFNKTQTIKKLSFLNLFEQKIRFNYIEDYKRLNLMQIRVSDQLEKGIYFDVFPKGLRAGEIFDMLCNIWKPDFGDLLVRKVYYSYLSQLKFNFQFNETGNIFKVKEAKTKYFQKLPVQSYIVPISSGPFQLIQSIIYDLNYQIERQTHSILLMVWQCHYSIKQYFEMYMSMNDILFQSMLNCIKIQFHWEFFMFYDSANDIQILRALIFDRINSGFEPKEKDNAILFDTLVKTLVGFFKLIEYFQQFSAAKKGLLFSLLPKIKFLDDPNEQSKQWLLSLKKTKDDDFILYTHQNSSLVNLNLQSNKPQPKEIEKKQQIPPYQSVVSLAEEELKKAREGVIKSRIQFMDSRVYPMKNQMSYLRPHHHISYESQFSTSFLLYAHCTKKIYVTNCHPNWQMLGINFFHSKDFNFHFNNVIQVDSHVQLIAAVKDILRKRQEKDEVQKQRKKQQQMIRLQQKRQLEQGNVEQNKQKIKKVKLTRKSQTVCNLKLFQDQQKITYVYCPKITKLNEQQISKECVWYWVNSHPFDNLLIESVKQVDVSLVSLLPNFNIPVLPHQLSNHTSYFKNNNLKKPIKNKVKIYQGFHQYYTKLGVKPEMDQRIIYALTYQVYGLTNFRFLLEQIYEIALQANRQAQGIYRDINLYVVPCYALEQQQLFGKYQYKKHETKYADKVKKNVQHTKIQEKYDFQRGLLSKFIELIKSASTNLDNYKQIQQFLLKGSGKSMVSQNCSANDKKPHINVSSSDLNDIWVVLDLSIENQVSKKVFDWVAGSLESGYFTLMNAESYAIDIFQTYEGTKNNNKVIVLLPKDYFISQTPRFISFPVIKDSPIFQPVKYIKMQLKMLLQKYSGFQPFLNLRKIVQNFVNLSEKINSKSYLNQNVMKMVVTMIYILTNQLRKLQLANGYFEQRQLDKQNKNLILTTPVELRQKSKNVDKNLNNMEDIVAFQKALQATRRELYKNPNSIHDKFLRKSQEQQKDYQLTLLSPAKPDQKIIDDQMKNILIYALYYSILLNQTHIDDLKQFLPFLHSEFESLYLYNYHIQTDKWILWEQIPFVNTTYAYSGDPGAKVLHPLQIIRLNPAATKIASIRNYCDSFNDGQSGQIYIKSIHSYLAKLFLVYDIPYVIQKNQNQRQSQQDKYPYWAIKKQLIAFRRSISTGNKVNISFPQFDRKKMGKYYDLLPKQERQFIYIQDVSMNDVVKYKPFIDYGRLFFNGLLYKVDATNLVMVTNLKTLKPQKRQQKLSNSLFAESLKEQTTNLFQDFPKQSCIDKILSKTCILRINLNRGVDESFHSPYKILRTCTNFSLLRDNLFENILLYKFYRNEKMTALNSRRRRRIPIYQASIFGYYIAMNEDVLKAHETCKQELVIILDELNKAKGWSEAIQKFNKSILKFAEKIEVKTSLTNHLISEKKDLIAQSGDNSAIAQSIMKQSVRQSEKQLRQTFKSKQKRRENLKSAKRSNNNPDHQFMSIFRKDLLYVPRYLLVKPKKYQNKLQIAPKPTYNELIHRDFCPSFKLSHLAHIISTFELSQRNIIIKVDGPYTKELSQKYVRAYRAFIRAFRVYSSNDSNKLFSIDDQNLDQEWVDLEEKSVFQKKDIQSIRFLGNTSVSKNSFMSNESYVPHEKLTLIFLYNSELFEQVMEYLENIFRNMVPSMSHKSNRFLIFVSLPRSFNEEEDLIPDKGVENDDKLDLLDLYDLNLSSSKDPSNQFDFRGLIKSTNLSPQNELKLERQVSQNIPNTNSLQEKIKGYITISEVTHQFVSDDPQFEILYQNYSADSNGLQGFQSNSKLMKQSHYELYLKLKQKMSKYVQEKRNKYFQQGFIGKVYNSKVNQKWLEIQKVTEQKRAELSVKKEALDSVLLQIDSLQNVKLQCQDQLSRKEPKLQKTEFQLTCTQNHKQFFIGREQLQEVRMEIKKHPKKQLEKQILKNQFIEENSINLSYIYVFNILGDAGYFPDKSGQVLQVEYKIDASYQIFEDQKKQFIKFVNFGRLNALIENQELFESGLTDDQIYMSAKVRNKFVYLREKIDSSKLYSKIQPFSIKRIMQNEEKMLAERVSNTVQRCFNKYLGYLFMYKYMHLTIVRGQQELRKQIKTLQDDIKFLKSKIKLTIGQLENLGKSKKEAMGRYEETKKEVIHCENNQKKFLQISQFNTNIIKGIYSSVLWNQDTNLLNQIFQRQVLAKQNKEWKITGITDNQKRLLIYLVSLEKAKQIAFNSKTIEAFYQKIMQIFKEEIGLGIKETKNRKEQKFSTNRSNQQNLQKFCLYFSPQYGEQSQVLMQKLLLQKNNLDKQMLKFSQKIDYIQAKDTQQIQKFRLNQQSIETIKFGIKNTVLRIQISYEGQWNRKNGQLISSYQEIIEKIEKTFATSLNGQTKQVKSRHLGYYVGLAGMICNKIGLNHLPRIVRQIMYDHDSRTIQNQSQIKERPLHKLLNPYKVKKQAEQDNLGQNLVTQPNQRVRKLSTVSSRLSEVDFEKLITVMDGLQKEQPINYISTAESLLHFSQNTIIIKSNSHTVNIFKQKAKSCYAKVIKQKIDEQISETILQDTSKQVWLIIQVSANQKQCYQIVLNRIKRRQENKFKHIKELFLVYSQQISKQLSRIQPVYFMKYAINIQAINYHQNIAQQQQMFKNVEKDDAKQFRIKELIRSGNSDRLVNLIQETMEFLFKNFNVTLKSSFPLDMIRSEISVQSKAKFLDRIVVLFRLLNIHDDLIEARFLKKIVQIIQSQQQESGQPKEDKQQLNFQTTKLMKVRQIVGVFQKWLNHSDSVPNQPSEIQINAQEQQISQESNKIRIFDLMIKPKVQMQEYTKVLSDPHIYLILNSAFRKVVRYIIQQRSAKKVGLTEKFKPIIVSNDLIDEMQMENSYLLDNGAKLKMHLWRKAQSTGHQISEYVVQIKPFNIQESVQDTHRLFLDVTIIGDIPESVKKMTSQQLIFTFRKRTQDQLIYSKGVRMIYADAKKVIKVKETVNQIDGTQGTGQEYQIIKTKQVHQTKVILPVYSKAKYEFLGIWELVLNEDQDLTFSFESHALI